MQLHIGIDDTDSTKGGCTTYIAARLVEIFTKNGIRFIDYPNIIRLNPNIPYKTRGNAAVALRVSAPEGDYCSIQESVLREIEQNSELGQAGTDPAVVFVQGRPARSIERFSQRALWDVLDYGDAVRIIKTADGSAAAYNSGMGLVGALAAIGQTLTGDHTFEMVAYRTKSKRGTKRRVDENSVKRMDRLTSPSTFNNYDFENRRILITPHGPDPVLLGIRGESPAIVRKAFFMLRVNEPIERWVIFRTNHGTDAHLKGITGNRLVEADRPIELRGVVYDRPWKIRGGHVFFTLRYRNRKIRCAAFEPTGKFREAIASLIPGDEIVAYGRAKKNLANQSLGINLERILVRHLVEEVDFQNPLCPICQKRMESAGQHQSFRCKNCSATVPKSSVQRVKRRRFLKLGPYVPDLKAHRHLTKPLIRYGHEHVWDRRQPLGKWHYP